MKILNKNKIISKLFSMSILYRIISITIFLSSNISFSQNYLTDGQQVPVYEPANTDSTYRHVYWDLTEINNSNNRLDIGVGVTHNEGSDNFINGNWYKNENNSNFNSEVTNGRFIYTVNDSKIINGFIFKMNDSTGKKDALVTRGNGEIQVYINSNGTIGSAIQNFNVYGKILGVGQFSTDSYEDAIILSNSGDTVKIYNGLGNGRLVTTPYKYYGIQPEKVLLAQMSNYIYPYSEINFTTADKDELIYREGQYIKILKNSNSNYLTPWISLNTNFTESTTNDFKVADFNNDGFNDLVVAQNKYGIKIFSNNGGNSFTLDYENTDYPYFHAYSVSIGDFNKDGFNDIAVLTTANISIYLNNKTSSLFSSTPSSVYYFDFPVPFKAFPMKSEISDLYNKGGLAVVFSATFDNFNQNYDVENVFRINSSDTDAVPAPPILFRSLTLKNGIYRPRIYMYNRGDRDFNKYRIYKRTPRLPDSLVYLGETTSNSFVDTTEYVMENPNGPRPTSFNCIYFTTCTDFTSHESINSDTAKYLVGDDEVCMQCGEEGDNFSSGNDLSNVPQVEDLYITNFPNPFNPVTKIYYTIPSAGNVRITVFNSLGQVIKELVNEFKTKGSYNIDFSATESGNNLASGIYFYRIEAGSFSQVRKMILLK